VARFLTDESLPSAISRAFVAAGHDVVNARDVGLRVRPTIRPVSQSSEPLNVFVVVQKVLPAY
jgi:hypothetical protein